MNRVTMKISALPLLLLLCAGMASAQLPGLYFTNTVLLTNGWGQFEVRTPDPNKPYALLRSWAKDFCYGIPRWEVEENFPLNSSTNQYLITIPVPMSSLGTIFFRAAPLGQPMYWLSYSIRSYATFSNDVGVVPWPKQPDGWKAEFTVQNATNFPAASEVFFTGPPDSGITNQPPDSDSGSAYQHYYYVSGPTALPPTSTWQVQYGAELLTFPMADPKVSSRYVVMVPTVIVSNGLLTSVSWTYHDPTTGVVLASLPAYITGSRSVTASVINGEDYDSPPADRTRSSHVFDPPPEWSNVTSVDIGFHDNLGNTFSFSYHK